MGDTKFVIRLPCSIKRPGRPEHVIYNSKCPPCLKIDEGYMWGYVYFRQVRDINLPRGYFQKVSKQVSIIDCFELQVTLAILTTKCISR